MEARLFALQRLSAIVMAPLVLFHLVMIFYAVRGGLTAAEIVARMQAGWWMPALYGLFAVAAAVHAPIGLRRILREWTVLPAHVVDPAMVALGLLLLALGLRAVAALVGAGA
ncbi:MAG: succinate dehydrogenase [Pseudomonadota bacterium]